ncbi:MAG: alpha-glucosidase C-terminal domain-containing protein, partial [Ardenticatenaceae bacterium]
PSILAIVRQTDSETIIALHNLSDDAQQIALDLPEFEGRRPVELLSSTLCPPITRQPYRLDLPPFAYQWLNL